MYPKFPNTFIRWKRTELRQERGAAKNVKISTNSNTRQKCLTHELYLSPGLDRTLTHACHETEVKSSMDYETSPLDSPRPVGKSEGDTHISNMGSH